MLQKITNNKKFDDVNFLIMPSGFKESLDSNEVANCIEFGIKKAIPKAKITKVPMIDGGEGFTNTLVKITNGRKIYLDATGPCGDTVSSFYGFLGNTDTAVIEMAASSGLRLVPKDNRDPRYTTSRGVGELIKNALDHGAKKIIVGCGDSGINDGGAGMASALGIKLLDKNNKILPDGGIHLANLCKLDFSELNPKLKNTKIEAAVNHKNYLTGKNSVSKVYAMQKGATNEQAAKLDLAMENYEKVISKYTPYANIGAFPGSGASGGLGTGLKALLGATLRPRYEMVADYINIDKYLSKSDIVFTAEGQLDYQTPDGKVPTEVAKIAKMHDVSVVAIAGSLGPGKEKNMNHGIDAYTSILEKPDTLEYAIANASELLIHSSEQIARLIKIGYNLKL